MIKRYMQFVKPYWLLVVLTIIIGIFKFGIPLLIPLLIKYVIDDIIINDALTVNEKIEQLFMMLGRFMFIFVVVRTPS